MFLTSLLWFSIHAKMHAYSIPLLPCWTKIISVVKKLLVVCVIAFHVLLMNEKLTQPQQKVIMPMDTTQHARRRNRSLFEQHHIWKYPTSYFIFSSLYFSNCQFHIWYLHEHIISWFLAGVVYIILIFLNVYILLYN